MKDIKIYTDRLTVDIVRDMLTGEVVEVKCTKCFLIMNDIGAGHFRCSGCRNEVIVTSEELERQARLIAAADHGLSLVESNKDAVGGELEICE